MLYFGSKIMGRKVDLEDRMVLFAVRCLEVCDKLPRTRIGFNLEHQLSRSSTAAALNYGEAQAAESTADFIHKLKIVLKEIRETIINLKIIATKPLLLDPIVDTVLNEAHQLMAIFFQSIKTAKENQQKRNT